MAHAFAKTAAAYPADGFSLPYQLSIAAEIVCFALLSLVLLRRLLRHYFDEVVAAWTILAIGVGTNYLEYSSIGGAHAHLNLFCYYATVALLARRFYRDPRWAYALGIGAVVGLSTLSRPTELMMALVPLLWDIRFTGAGLAARYKLLVRHAPKLLCAAVLGAAIIALQPLYWHWATGDWVVYSYQDQGFSFIKTHFHLGLASFRGGWLPYTPMGLLMLGGFYFVRRRLPTLMPGVLAYLLFFMYIVWSWDLWQYGGSLGQRTMVQVYPLLALPLASLFEWTLAPERRPWQRWGIAASFGVSLLVNLFWTHQAHRGGMFAAGEMTAPYYWAVLGTFDRDRDKFRFLDRVEDFRGVMRRPVSLLREGYETGDLTYTCAPEVGALVGAQSLCIQAGTENLPPLYVPKPSADQEYLRVSFDFEVREKTWASWAMAQVILAFKRADGSMVYSYFLRPERLLDGGRRRLHFDGKLPDANDYASIELLWWKPGLGGLVVVDEVEVIAFGE